MRFTSVLKSLKDLDYDNVEDMEVGKFGKVVEMIHPKTKTACAVKFVKDEIISVGGIVFLGLVFSQKYLATAWI